MVGQGILATDNPAGDSIAAPPTPATDDWPLMYLRDPALPCAVRLRPGDGRRDRARADLRPGAARRPPRLQRAHVLPRRGVHAARNAQPGHVLAAVRLDVAGQLAGVLRDPVQRHAGGVPVSSTFPTTAVAAAVRGCWWRRCCWRTWCRRTRSCRSTTCRCATALASLVAFLPVFLANLVFAGSFKGTGPTADMAFASNLIGIMVGGMLEYASLLIGYRNLLLIVIAFYLLSAWLLRRRRAPAAAPKSSRACRSPSPMVEPRAGAAASRWPNIRACGRSRSFRSTTAARGAWCCAIQPTRTCDRSCSATGRAKCSCCSTVSGPSARSPPPCGCAVRRSRERKCARFVERLDEAGFLEGPRAEHRLRERLDAFGDADAHRGPRWRRLPGRTDELPRFLGDGYMDPDGPGALPGPRAAAVDPPAA